jgi:hypothetical protein
MFAAMISTIRARRHTGTTNARRKRRVARLGLESLEERLVLSGYPPAAPVFTAIPYSSSQVNLLWQSVPGATSYQVEQVENGSWKQLGSVGVGSSTIAVGIPGLKANTAYDFDVVATNAYGSNWGSQEFVTTPAAGPSSIPASLADYSLTATGSFTGGGGSFRSAGQLLVTPSLTGVNTRDVFFSVGNTTSLFSSMVFATNTELYKLLPNGEGNKAAAGNIELATVAESNPNTLSIQVYQQNDLYASLNTFEDPGFTMPFPILVGQMTLTFSNGGADVAGTFSFAGVGGIVPLDEGAQGTFQGVKVGNGSSTSTAATAIAAAPAAGVRYANLVMPANGGAIAGLGINPYASMPGGIPGATTADGIAALTDPTPNGPDYTLKVRASGPTGTTTGAFDAA